MISAFDTIGLTAAFVLCASLLLWIIIGARGWWWIKLPVIALTLYFGLAVWYSVDSYMGWPSKHDPPRRFQVHWVIVDEPVKGSKDPGAIYVMLTQMPHPDDEKIELSWKRYVTILGYSGRERSPRLYQVPYTRPLHQQMAKIQGMLMKGQVVVGEFTPGKGMGQPDDGEGKPGEGNGQGKGKGKDGKAGKGRGYRGDNWGMGDWKFYQLPPPKHIPKIDGPANT